MTKLLKVTALTLLSLNVSAANNYECSGSEKETVCKVKFSGSLYSSGTKVTGSVECSEAGSSFLSESLGNFDIERDTISKSLMFSLDSGKWVPDDINPSRYMENTSAFFYEINEHTSGRITRKSNLDFFHAAKKKMIKLKMKCQEI